MSQPTNARLGFLPNLIFASRWLQLPLYLGLIVAQAVYVWQFGVELVHLVSEVFLPALCEQLHGHQPITTNNKSLPLTTAFI